MKLAFGFLLAALCLSASTTYTQAVTSVTQVTITGATHGLGCDNFGVRVYDGSGDRRNDLVSSVIINGRNDGSHDVIVNFSTAFTGSVKLQGCFSYTSASTDFEVTYTSGQVTFCGACSDTTYAARTTGSKNYVAVTYATVIADATGNESGTLYVWLDPATGLQNWGTTSAHGVYGQSGSSVLIHNISGYPAGSVHLARLDYHTGFIYSVTDDRPF